jgi:hypothetical protein
MASGYSKPLYLPVFDHYRRHDRAQCGGAAVRQIADHYLETVNGFVV